MRRKGGLHGGAGQTGYPASGGAVNCAGCVLSRPPRRTQKEIMPRPRRRAGPVIASSVMKDPPEWSEVYKSKDASPPPAKPPGAAASAGGGGGGGGGVGGDPAASQGGGSDSAKKGLATNPSPYGTQLKEEDRRDKDKERKFNNAADATEAAIASELEKGKDRKGSNKSSSQEEKGGAASPSGPQEGGSKGATANTAQADDKAAAVEDAADKQQADDKAAAAKDAAADDDDDEYGDDDFD